jgi:HlyD family secretion protein
MSEDSIATLTSGVPRERSRAHRRPLVIAVIITVVVAAVLVVLLRDGNARTLYRTEPITRGPLVVEVTATGTLQPVNQVQVGSELSGTVEWVGVDYNDRVRVGQVMARLDTEELEARAVQSRAALRAAQARVSEAEATVEESRLRMDRCLALLAKQMCTQESADNNRAAWMRAKAGVASAAAQVEVAQATLAADETKLRKAVIVAPIEGVVLSRTIEPGQTVASMMQTPVLFTLAEDLSQLQLHVDVDEADVGRVREGQVARFTVDAYPDRSFEARITQVRYAPKTVQGVVTYETLLALDNPDLALRPGMTATAEIVVARLDEALLLPNAALRYRPAIASEREERPAIQRLMPGPPFRRAQQQAPALAESSQRTVWRLKDGEPAQVAIAVGATDGRFTEIVNGDLAAGDAVIVGFVERGG